MDPFHELMYRRPVPVKSTNPASDFDFDEGLIDRVLGRPNKIDIPERYIPEREHLAPEEEQKRSQKAEAICRLLSKSSTGPVPLVLPHLDKRNHSLQTNQNVQNNSRCRTSKSIPRWQSASESLGVNAHLWPSSGSSPHLQASSSHTKSSLSSRHNSRHATRNSLACDWSLAGVSAPSSPHPSGAPRNSSYSSSATNLYAPASQNNSLHWMPTRPIHSYHSSYSSTSSGRSSSDREELLHLQHNIAREVTEKSRLVAVRAAASSPSPRPYRFSSEDRFRDPTPPSPTELPTVQQREGFFT